MARKTNGNRKQVHRTPGQIKEKALWDKSPDKSYLQSIVTRLESPAVSPAPTVPLPEGLDTVAPLLLTTAQTCAFLNISRMTLHRLEKSGGLIARVMLDSKVRYHRPTLEAWVLQQIGGKL